MKKLQSVLLALCLLLTMAAPVSATEIAETDAPARAENQCGESMTWAYADGVLTISGSGAMDDFEQDAPWAAHKKDITRVVLSGSISYIGARAFTNFDALTAVDFGNSLYEIGKEAFKSCDGLTEVWLPASFKVFGEASFMSCSGLTAIHCSGRFPSFRQNCLWDTYCKIYYPADHPWGVQYIEQMETAFKGRIEFLASDGTDHYQPTEATLPVTEAPTEEPTEAPTQAPTEEPTLPPTEAPTAPENAPVTVPGTRPPVTEGSAQTAPNAPQETESRSMVGFVIIGAVAAFLLLGMIAVRAGSGRGRYAKRRRQRRKR